MWGEWLEMSSSIIGGRGGQDDEKREETMQQTGMHVESRRFEAQSEEGKQISEDAGACRMLPLLLYTEAERLCLGRAARRPARWL